MGRLTRAGYGLVRGCHPEPTAAVTVVAAVLAAAVGRGVAGTAAVAAAVLAGQLSIGWSNDWLDASRDAAAGRTDKPAATGELAPVVLGRAACVAAACCVPLSLLSGWLAGATHLVAVASGWLYNRPLKATPVSVLPYLVSFGLLPTFVVLGVPAVPPWWLVAAGAALGGGAHFFNTLPDLAADRAAGVRGLPHRIGAGPSWLAGALLLLTCSGLLAYGTGSVFGLVGFAVAAVALVVGAAAGRRPGSRATFRTVLVVALVDVALLVLAGTRLT
ncbi:MAG TPA: UbiA family prenyltransferase [Actinocatenispora sp.]